MSENNTEQKIEKKVRKPHKKHRPFLHTNTKPTNTGEKYIISRQGKRGTTYTLRIQSQGIQQSFKTLDEAIRKRDEFLNQFNTIGQMIQKNRTSTSLTFDDEKILWEYIIKKISS